MALCLYFSITYRSSVQFELKTFDFTLLFYSGRLRDEHSFKTHDDDGDDDDESEDDDDDDNDDEERLFCSIFKSFVFATPSLPLSRSPEVP